MHHAELVSEGCFHFDPEDPIYTDHFPGNPVVPGSLIIDAFVTAARAAMKGQGQCLVENFRFKHFICPDRYVFTVERKTDGRMLCRLYANGRAVVTGTLNFELIQEYGH